MRLRLDGRLWDTRTGAPLYVLEGHFSWPIAVALSADGSRGLSGAGDNLVMFWDMTVAPEHVPGA